MQSKLKATFSTINCNWKHGKSYEILQQFQKVCDSQASFHLTWFTVILIWVALSAISFNISYILNSGWFDRPRRSATYHIFEAMLHDYQFKVTFSRWFSALMMSLEDTGATCLPHNLALICSLQRKALVGDTMPFHVSMLVLCQKLA